MPAFAIPSPELVVGAVTSVSQLLALLSAVVGGGALAAGAKLRQSSLADRKRTRNLQRGLGAVALLAALSVGGNIYQHVTAGNAAQARLEASLLRPTPKAEGGAALDPLLREIPYSAQLTHPLGLTTEEAAAIVQGVGDGTRPDWMILDIRETAEVEQGSFKGAQKVRFPDIASAHIDFAARKALLICHNGNRSAETCAALAEKGIDCRFIRGGLEKWLSEQRPLDGLAARSIDDLRKIADYPNHTVLLDTPEVHRLVADEKAVFVDVRYPGEFAASHIKGAINLPLRPTPTAEVQARLAALPDSPVIVPCYDRRSCFFGEILGLELTRAGRRFLGRYTVPWEYFEPSKRPPHVEAALAEANRTWWSRAAEALAGALERLTQYIAFPWAVLLLALVSRLLVLPFSLKAERDQIAGADLGDDVKALKARLGHEPWRLHRAMRALYASRGLTPGRNLIALLFLPVLALSIEAVVQVAARLKPQWLWVSDLSGSDTTYMLPALFALVLTGYVHWALAHTTRARLLCWLVLAPLLAFGASLLPAAASLYVVLSGLLLLAQRAMVVKPWRTLGPLWARMKIAITRWRLGHPGLVPLADVARLSNAGNKALRLAQLRAKRFPVPAGVVLTEAFLKAFETMTPRQRRRALNRVWRHLGGRPLAVRSSAAGEDGANESYAGVFMSRLDVTRAALPAAVGEVCGSFAAARAASYGDGGAGRNILIQPMVAALRAGVLFTEDPQAPGLMLIESVRGTADRLVSGLETPSQVRAGRLTGAVREGSTCDLNYEHLMHMARGIEAEFGTPQDIEWAYARGRFCILQARDITVQHAALAACEWRRLSALAASGGGAGAVLRQTEMSEMLPRPTALSLSLLNRLWAAGGSVDLAMRGLGLIYTPPEDDPGMFTTAFGRLYLNAAEQARRSGAVSPLTLAQVRRRAKALEHSFLTDYEPALDDTLRVLSAADYSAMSEADLQILFHDTVERFVTSTHPGAEVINIAAQVYMDDAVRLLAKTGRDPASLLAASGPTNLSRALSEALALTGAAQTRALRRVLGHRSNLDYELAEPRHREDDAQLQRVAETLAAAGEQPATPLPSDLPKPLAAALARARRFQVLKEDAKHICLREVSEIRRLALALGKQSGLGALVFHLTLDEVASLTETTHATLAAAALDRQRLREDLLALPPLGAEVTQAELEMGPLYTAAAGGGDGLSGTRVSGAELAEGRAFVVSAQDAEQGLPLAAFAKGDVLVAPMVHPAWLPEVLRAGGVICQVGGWLSHMAIVGRERGVAMVTGVKDVSTIRTGDWVRLHHDGRIEVAAGAPETAEAAAMAAE